ncbi:helix-turn-helix transcriptional regulator [Achromobacter xylosoxidans]|uniref:helix-turn-helix transcriptional regulator n=1 Tax=Alcaligenes xylosoxydans xylosoxydans TaxID=85698 RepID=UPI001F13DCB2|nr:helix-turn-helix transcriptional regulator [Achromobacter xylosoxidans]
MPSVSASRAPCTERRFGDIASAWGYDGHVDAAHRPDLPPDQRIVAQGHIHTATTASGLRMCASDLLATRNHIRSADLGRSLTVYAMLDGPALDWRHGPSSRPQCGTAHAAVLAVRDEARMTEAHQAGQHSRCLVVQVTPDTLIDATLAELVQTCLRRTQARPLPSPGRLRAIATDMLAPRAGGAIARLWLESCALDMLARGLRSLGDAAQTSDDARLHPLDRRRMLRVRDRLLAEPGHPHRLADLARDAGVSVSTLKQKFPLVAGAPVFEYLRQVRLERARDGLLHEGWSVKQAAFYAGYRHPTNFTTAYRRRFGAAPSRG